MKYLFAKSQHSSNIESILFKSERTTEMPKKKNEREKGELNLNLNFNDDCIKSLNFESC